MRNEFYLLKFIFFCHRPSHRSSGGGDLRDRIGRSKYDYRGSRGSGRNPPSSNRDGPPRDIDRGRLNEEDRAKRDERLKKFMSVEEKGRRDYEDKRRERKRMEREMMEMEDRLKRKRDRSAEGKENNS